MYKLNACKKYHKANENILRRIESKGWTVDRFGHAKKEINGKLYRYKFQNRNVRYERQIVIGAYHGMKGTKEWMLVKTYNYNPAK